MWGNLPQTQPGCFEERSCSLPRGICPERTSLSTLLFKALLRRSTSLTAVSLLGPGLRIPVSWGPAMLRSPVLRITPRTKVILLFVAAVFRCLMFNLHTARVPYTQDPRFPGCYPTRTMLGLRIKGKRIFLRKSALLGSSDTYIIISHHCYIGARPTNESLVFRHRWPTRTMLEGAHMVYCFCNVNAKPVTIRWLLRSSNKRAYSLFNLLLNASVKSRLLSLFNATWLGGNAARG